MKHLAYAFLLLVCSSGLVGCAAIAESLIESALGIDDDDEPQPESREKRQRRADYNSGNTPTIQLD